MESDLSPAVVELLEQLAQTPLADRIELAALSGRSAASVYRDVEALSGRGLVEAIPHATVLLPRTSRFLITAAGLARLAQEQGASPAELLQAWPVSEQWRRSLLRRLDGVGACYRLASGLAEVAYPLRLRWYRASPADAGVALADGRTLAVVRIGRTVERSATAQRMRRLGQGPGYSAALVLAPDDTRLRQLRRLARGLPFGCFLALERHALAASADDAVWIARAGGPALSLEDMLGYVSGPGEWGRERTPARRSMPRSVSTDEDSDASLSSRLGAAEKRALDLVGDWPWLAPLELEGLMGVGRRRVSQLTGSLRELELVAEARVEGQRRLTPTDRALALLARRDRASPHLARRRWSSGPIEPERAPHWRDVPGRRSRQLLRHIGHTAAVHRFAAALAEQARDFGCELLQLDPPQRASRYFRSAGVLRSIHPDAFFMLRAEGERRPAFLEWERRAIRPQTMRTRLAPYLRYFATRRPTDDHGVRPQLWLVFDDPLAADRFLTVARAELARTRVELPLMVSDRERIADLGPLGAAWRGADGWDWREPLAPR
ncbi:MAG: replication-relaxation family protein [Chloroflexi bacterium]|nr:replication-relaxation family protein [Chloroflexota bacterium]MCY3587662.1 replication-relaxation family protein [Chloroflexota bacterium]MCY3684561.1 replication-relaxation family protein [Chloroflexota bacterium]MDE2710099.1 replication-relaxation family protein [Chloroflexota bacterium]